MVIRIRTIFSLLCMTLLSNAIHGQDYYGYTKEEIRVNFKLEESDDPDFKLIIEETTASLLINLEGYDNIELSYFFNDFELCDSIVIAFHCQDCVENHLNTILNGRRDKWVAIQPNHYLERVKTMKFKSKRETTFSCPKLIIDPPTAGRNYTIAYFSIQELDKKSWKQLKKRGLSKGEQHHYRSCGI